LRVVQASPPSRLLWSALLVAATTFGGPGAGDALASGAGVVDASWSASDSIGPVGAHRGEPALVHSTQLVRAANVAVQKLLQPHLALLGAETLAFVGWHGQPVVSRDRVVDPVGRTLLVAPARAPPPASHARCS
jgi:hypothetical protein